MSDRDSNDKDQATGTEFQVGERVVIRSDFHSKYFQGLHGTIAGPARKGGTSDPLWPVKLDVPPHETVMAGKYLRRPEEEELIPQGQDMEGTNGEGSGDADANSSEKKSFFARILGKK